jgi:hypothetical protein
MQLKQVWIYKFFIIETPVSKSKEKDGKNEGGKKKERKQTRTELEKQRKNKIKENRDGHEPTTVDTDEEAKDMNR